MVHKRAALRLKVAWLSNASWPLWPWCLNKTSANRFSVIYQALVFKLAGRLKHDYPKGKSLSAEHILSAVGRVSLAEHIHTHTVKAHSSEVINQSTTTAIQLLVIGILVLNIRCSRESARDQTLLPCKHLKLWVPSVPPPAFTLPARDSGERGYAGAGRAELPRALTSASQAAYRRRCTVRLTQLHTV